MDDVNESVRVERVFNRWWQGRLAHMVFDTFELSTEKEVSCPAIDDPFLDFLYHFVNGELINFYQGSIIFAPV